MSQVYVDELVEDDYLFICQSLHPSIPETVLSKLILFNNRLYEDTMIHRKFAHEGSPWEFNLRDIIRSCQVIEGLIFSQDVCTLFHKCWICSSLIGFLS